MMETAYDILKSLGYGLLALLLCWLARLLYTVNPARGRLDWKLLEARNTAAALDAAGYFIAVILTLGGTISWAVESPLEGAFQTVAFGLYALLLLNASMWAADQTYLKDLKLSQRIKDGSAGAGLLRAAHEAALGLTILGASWGEADGMTISVFWLLGQLLLGAAVKLWFKAAKVNLAAELEKRNEAAAVSAAGVALGLGFIAWSSLSGEFLGWGRSLLDSVVYYAVGVAGIAGFRWAADLALLPGATFREEVLKGNASVGLLDAGLTLGVSVLLTWCLI
ncbi:MAG: hypothetical protein PHV33_05550 [Elusimicrobiales bacterium]|nr:hypothetical protein [Elusimicrobiales bacterium]